MKNLMFAKEGLLALVVIASIWFLKSTVFTVESSRASAVVSLLSFSLSLWSVFNTISILLSSFHK